MMDEDLVNKLVSTIYNSDLADDLLVLKLEDELNSLVEDIIKLGGKSALKDYEKEDLKHYIENCHALITVLKYHTIKEYTHYIEFLVDYEDLLKDNDSKEQNVNLDLEEALYCAKIGLEVLLYCNLADIPTTELPELIRLRGEYLKQEEDPDGGSFTGLDLNNIPEPNKEMKKMREEYVAVRKAQAEKSGYEHG
jgi:hypothetical protein